MNATPTQQTVRLNPATIAPVLRTLALCDLVDSTALIQQLGDQGGAEFFRRHDRLCRDLVQKYDGLEIDKTDGFLLLFDRPIQAVAFALDYQRQLHALGEAEFLPLNARIGIHVGDVMLWENTPADIAQGAKPVELEGLVKPVAARLMNLALPGQILLSGIAYVLAQRAQIELDREQPLPQWRAHGSYRFKGVDEPVPVFEVGEGGIAPLRAPSYSGKAHREVPWWRRPGMLIAEAAVLALAVIVPVYISLRSPPAIAFAKRDWIVVGDFKNLTGETVFDDSLQTAFRIGLEQSRYINVLSDLKVRDTIKLMQRDPEQTRVDRATGAEVAIREGARALILPTIAEIGGRVRVTAEVIDPKSQATVYSESADGLGAQSVLPSLDKVNQQLRVRLGEALATVSNESQPLEKVTTKNLEALKAYSLCERTYASGNWKETLGYCQEAIRLDPTFAMARVVAAKAFLNIGDNAAGWEQIRAADQLHDRLSSRDALYLDAWQATLTSAIPVALEKWRLVTNLYPDFYPAFGAYAYYAWNANRYELATSAAEHDVAPRNPHASSGKYQLGILYLANERYADAQRQFDAAAADGLSQKSFPALVYAAKREFEKARILLDVDKSIVPKTTNFDIYFARVAIAVDQGQWKEASTLLDSMKTAAGPAGNRNNTRIEGINFGLQSLFAKSLDLQQLRDYANTEIGANPDNHIDKAEARFRALFATWLVSRSGDAQQAETMFANLGTNSNDSDDPMLVNLQALVRAELARIGGHPGEAVATLKPMIDGNELYVTHLGLMDAYAANDAKAEALQEAQWLSSHRGRAYAEFGANEFMKAFNIALSNLAILRAAELSHDLKNDRAAAESLAAFRKAWPNAENSPAIDARIKTLTAAL